MSQSKESLSAPGGPSSEPLGFLSPGPDADSLRRFECRVRVPHRLDFHVIGRILSALVSHGGTSRPTQLQCASLVNYARFEGYVFLLRARHLVDVNRDATSNPTISITSLGREAEMSICKSVRYLEE